MRRGYTTWMDSRQYDLADRLVFNLNRALVTLTGSDTPDRRPNPGRDVEPAPMEDAEKRHAGRLMRVNHAGEVAAQALYHGQSVTARLDQVREAMDQAADEEADHLAWCEQRLDELGTPPSRLAPLWYTGSFAIGALAGLAGDRWSLGFVTETEDQVCRHLDDHLERLPEDDGRSRAILEQMKADEMHHGQTARDAGGADLPEPVRNVMRLVSRIMTNGAYWL